MTRPRLDPILALAVAGNIAVTGIGLVRRSIEGLMDRSPPAESQAAINRVIHAYATSEVDISRAADTPGWQPIIHLVTRPGSRLMERARWPYLLEQLERDLRGAVPNEPASSSH